MRRLLIVTLLTSSFASATESLSEEEKAEAAYRAANSIVIALKLYFLDNGSYPSTEQGLAVLASVNASSKGAYLKREPIDPWGRAYAYSASSPCPYAFSLGADGSFGGDGYDADVYPYGMPCENPNK